ncbi:MAG TPA: hypothetical protein VJ436_14025, partial [Anaerolineales bacterium]|nr:hypothetical protein [Anaerolineales bacterium]
MHLTDQERAMVIFPTPANNTRLGFHYFPDTAHYRESDLHAWLPELQALGASWLVLLSPSSRAIPEQFLTGLIEAGIEPILHFPFSQAAQPNPQELGVLFENYSRWGVHYVVLSDRPNNRFAWPAAAWSQHDLVERFIDRFLPTAEMALGAGLQPALPPLEPGGDYWDTAFLRAALQSLERRGKFSLLERLVLSAHASPGQQPLNWGSGGPERWPGARPYTTPPGSEDQRGFRIFDWYLAIAQAVLGKPCPILLLGVCSRPADPLPSSSAAKNNGQSCGNGYASNGHSPNSYSPNSYS